MTARQTDILSFFSEERIFESSRGQNLYFAGEVPRKLKIICSGTVKAYTVNTNDEHRTIGLFDESEILPIECLLDNQKACRYNYQAVTDISHIEVSVRKLKAAIHDNAELKDLIFRQVSKSLLGSFINIEALVQPKVRDKIIYSFRYLLQRYGKKDDDGLWVIESRITQSDIANIIGISRETVALEVNKMKKEGLINYRSFRYSLNLNKLVTEENLESWKEFIV